MARARRVVALALAAYALAAPANAQGLRMLHVDALSMRADATTLHVGEPFHLAIHARVGEQVAALDELVVPDVGTMQLLGDERRATHSASGTDIVETLTLAPTTSGSFTFQGAYLDAIDARTKRPSRFSANAVRVVVSAPAPSAPVYWRVVKTIAGVALAAAGIVAAGAMLVMLVRTRRRREGALPVHPPVTAPPPPPRTPLDEVAEAVRAYRSAPANGALTRIRAALFVAAGSAPGETVRDALAATSDHALRVALIAAERTTFGPLSAREASASELLDAAETWLSR